MAEGEACGPEFKSIAGLSKLQNDWFTVVFLIVFLNDFRYMQVHWSSCETNDNSQIGVVDEFFAFLK